MATPLPQAYLATFYRSASAVSMLSLPPLASLGVMRSRPSCTFRCGRARRKPKRCATPCASARRACSSFEDCGMSVIQTRPPANHSTCAGNSNARSQSRCKRAKVALLMASTGGP